MDEKVSKPLSTTEKRNIIVFTPEELAIFGLFDGLTSDSPSTSGAARQNETESVDASPSRSEKGTEITDNTKKVLNRQVEKRDTARQGSTLKFRLPNSNHADSLDFQRTSLGEILKRSFDRKSQPGKHNTPKSSTVVQNILEDWCAEPAANSNNEAIVIEDEDVICIDCDEPESNAKQKTSKPAVKVIGIAPVQFSSKEIQHILKGSKPSPHALILHEPAKKCGSSEQDGEDNVRLSQIVFNEPFVVAHQEDKDSKTETSGDKDTKIVDLDASIKVEIATKGLRDQNVKSQLTEDNERECNDDFEAKETISKDAEVDLITEESQRDDAESRIPSPGKDAPEIDKPEDVQETVVNIKIIVENAPRKPPEVRKRRRGVYERKPDRVIYNLPSYDDTSGDDEDKNLTVNRGALKVVKTYKFGRTGEEIVADVIETPKTESRDSDERQVVVKKRGRPKGSRNGDAGKRGRKPKGRKVESDTSEMESEEDLSDEEWTEKMLRGRKRDVWAVGKRKVGRPRKSESEAKRREDNENATAEILEDNTLHSNSKSTEDDGDDEKNDNSVENSTLHPNSDPERAKGKRGRKPKLRQSVDDETRGTSPETKIMEERSDDERANRKRGRKSRQSSDNEESEENRETGNAARIGASSSKGRSGRKPKIRKVETETEAEENGVTKSEHLSDTHLDTSKGETPARRRGRPRKQALPTAPRNRSTVIDPSPTELCPIEESKSGRKRKKINYYNLENNLYDDAKIPPADADHVACDTPNAKSPYVGRKRGRKSKKELSETVEDNEAENDEVATDVPETVDDEKNVNGLKRYRKTGKTVEMINNVFAAAVSTMNESQDLNESQTEQLLESPGRKKTGRPTREEKRIAYLDDNNQVTCAACNEQMDDSLWNGHKTDVHCDLAWRKGEPPLDLDNSVFVRRRVEGVFKGRGKLPCDKCDSTFKSVDAFLVHREACLGIVVNSNVICAICKEEMDKGDFYNHRQKKHNSLAWRVGDIPLDLSNQAFVMSVLNARYKQKKPLYCYKCNTAKKSVIGFLSHQAQCGISEENAKVSCPECNRRVLPVSLPVHMKLVHGPSKKVRMKDAPEEVMVEGIRKAARNAKALLSSLSKGNFIDEAIKTYTENSDFSEDFVEAVLSKELEENKILKCKFNDCDFSTIDVGYMIDHLIGCDCKPMKYYLCNKCLTIRGTDSEMVQHVQDVHTLDMKVEPNLSDEESEGEYIFDIKPRKKSFVGAQKDVYCKVKPLCITQLHRNTKGTLFDSAFEYTLEFCNNCYTQSELFTNLCCPKDNWKLLDDALLENYLPRSETSCEVGTKQVRGFEKVTQSFFNRFELFEVKSQENHVTLYCGGPIHALAWLPTPYLMLDCRQVLAVAAGSDFDGKYCSNVNYSESTVVQFWDFGVLKNRHGLPMPRLMYCLAVDIGPIWYLEWCPSGCYTDKNINSEKMPKLGMLAVAGSTAQVHIYVLPKVNEDMWGLVYRAKPVLKLQPTTSERIPKDKYYPTKISWSKASGHKVIAVAYTNGMVGLYNIDTTSVLSKFKDEDDIDVMVPYKLFQAHKHCISVLQLLHLGEGNRWLLTGSFEKVHLWDLKNDTNVNLPVKKTVSDGIWLTNWLSSAIAFDECSTSGPIGPQLLFPRHYLSESTIISYSRSTITSIAASDWLNAIAYTNTAGEVIMNFAQQMLFAMESDKYLTKYRKILGYTRLIKKTEENCSKPVTYKKAVEEYGVVFCDMKMDKHEDFPSDIGQQLSASNTNQQQSEPEMYAVQSINKISFNPNCQASLYYATGYQIGFVRIGYLKFMESDKQVV